MNALAALAFALAGIHVGGTRVMQIGYAPAWSPSGERIAFVTNGDLWGADETDAIAARPATGTTCVVAERAPLPFTRGGRAPFASTAWTSAACSRRAHRLVAGR
jgi:hypothetical protein